MNLSNHIISFLLAVLLHLLGLLVVGNRVVFNAAVAAAAPDLDVTSVELTLSEEAAPDAPAGPSSEARALPDVRPAARSPELPALPPLPDPVAPAPAEEPPDKPDFTAAPVPPPPPALQPQPSPVVLPQPAAPPAPPVDPPAPETRLPPPVPAAPPAGPPATLQPLNSGESNGGNNGGGGAYGRVDGHPSLDRAIKPNYPIGARRRGEEGTVILDVTVAADGSAAKTALVSSSGFPELDRSAQRAAAQARFKPGTRDGQPVESAARLTLIFRLRDS